MLTFVKGKDIALSSADAIVNAANGIGHMGGKSGVFTRGHGVAESIHFISQGSVEKLAKTECRKQGILGYAPGEVFITSAPNLNCKYVIHAVTMRFPGSKSRIKTIKRLLPKIIMLAEQNDIKSVAIPLLGTGTGRLSMSEVLHIYKEILPKSKIHFMAYLPQNNF